MKKGINSVIEEVGIMNHMHCTSPQTIQYWQRFTDKALALFP